MDEVRKHKLEGEMWTVLKGRVYNISPYMKFHPGGTAISSIFMFISLLFLLLFSLKLYMHLVGEKSGVDMLMKTVGKDCTSLFSILFCYFPTVLFKFVSLLHLSVSIFLGYHNWNYSF